MFSKSIATFLLGSALLLLSQRAFTQQPASQAQAPAAPTTPGNPPLPSSTASPDHPKPGVRNPRYKIEPDDILDLSFRYTPEFDQEVTVQPDGFVQLKGLQNDVHVQGLTVPEVIAELQKAYANVLHDPVISIVLRDFEKPYFIAGGQVGKPGKYDLRGDTTATQAVAIAGGFVDFAKSKQVILFRRYDDNTVETKVLNLKKVLNKKDLQEDLMLQPGDMLYVPKTFMATIDRFLPRSSIGTYFAPALL